MEKFTMMGWYGGGMAGFGMLAMGVFWLAPLGLIIWLVVRLLPASGGGTGRPDGESPLEILDRRLASGGIDLETWQAQRDALVAAQLHRK
jgi:putative membrane protein